MVDLLPAGKVDVRLLSCPCASGSGYWVRARIDVPPELDALCAGLADRAAGRGLDRALPVGWNVRTAALAAYRGQVATAAALHLRWSGGAPGKAQVGPDVDVRVALEEPAVLEVHPQPGRRYVLASGGRLPMVVLRGWTTAEELAAMGLEGSRPGLRALPVEYLHRLPMDLAHDRVALP